MSQKPFLTFALIAAASVAACQTTGQDTAPAPAADTRAPAFVEAACGGCHAVEPPFLSVNPKAPDFEAIANRNNLTEASLAEWLSNAHNYPEDMDFDLTEEQVDQIAVYMVTLRRDDYEPAE